MWLLMFFESVCFFFFKQKTAYEMRISDWSSDVCSSDLRTGTAGRLGCHTVLAVKGGACVHARGLQPSATLDRCAAACGAGAGQSRPVPEHAPVVFFLRFSAVCSRPESSLPAISEERRSGKECVSKCSSRGLPYHKKKKIKVNV